MIFGRCPQDAFARGLELGAGDGFQSTLLARYVRRLVATDYRPQIIPPFSAASDGAAPNVEGKTGSRHEAAGAATRVEFMTCDAERVDEVFGTGEFDLVFSSNMMEHLPDPGRALRGVATVLAGDGIAIHVIPSTFWKFCHIAGFYPNAVWGRADRFVRRRSEAAVEAGKPAEEASLDAWDNNPKVATRPRPYLARLLWPAAHGASGSNLREFQLFSRSYWLKQFAAAGFRVAATQRGPVSSGYGFGWDAARTALERAGVASEIVYITVKASCAPEQLGRLRYFE